MESTLRDLNHYLYLELGIDGDESQVSDSWPFQLEPTERLGLFRFHFDGEDFYAVADEFLDCYPTRGMSVEDIALQEEGSAWIAAHDPVDLDTIRIGDERVPRLPKRRAAVEQMARSALGAEAAEAIVNILEGLYLAKLDQYFSLVEIAGSDGAILLWSGGVLRDIGFPRASRNRRVAYAVGRLLRSNHLKYRP